MWRRLQPSQTQAAVWLVLCALGCMGLTRLSVQELREAFETDARISHRLLSQRVVQHEAILATLALLQPPAQPTALPAALPAAQPPVAAWSSASSTSSATSATSTTSTTSTLQRLSAVYPQVLQVQQRPSTAPWSDADLTRAEQVSAQSRAPALAHVDFAAPRGRYQLVLAAHPTSYALRIDVHATVPWDEWSMPVDSSPVRVALVHAEQEFVIQQGRSTTRAGDRPWGWHFEFRKHLASASQPFELVAQRTVRWAELPWWHMLFWSLAMAAGVLLVSGWQRQRQARVRAEQLLRVGQVARLNALGELAAGMAHELNQPLTAVLANTQAAKRLLREEPLELTTVQGALDQAATQARRASDVLSRMRRLVEQPSSVQALQTISLDDAVRSALALLEPECQQRGVVVNVHSTANGPVRVQADRVALEQIIHNLITNALQALDQVPPAQRQLHLSLDLQRPFGALQVADTGAGIAAHDLPHIFEPFFSTREGGLGLGLSLCETLATSMGGQLRAEAPTSGGAIFTLRLPLCEDSP